MKNFFYILLIISLTGCVTRSVKRPVEIAGQLAYEKHRISMFMVDSNAAKVTAELTDGDYKYKVGATDLSFLSDEEFVKEFGGAIGNALKEVATLNP